MQKVKSCGVLVFRDEPERSFLLMKHPRRYDLPKGHLDPGETERQCALRELGEETGIPADAVALDAKFRFTTRYQVRYRHAGDQLFEKTLVVFLGELQREIEIVPTEHPGFVWLPWNPPHQVQRFTIDPLLAQVERYWKGRSSERSDEANPIG